MLKAKPDKNNQCQLIGRANATRDEKLK